MYKHGVKIPYLWTPHKHISYYYVGCCNKLQFNVRGIKKTNLYHVNITSEHFIKTVDIRGLDFKNWLLLQCELVPVGRFPLEIIGT